MSANDSSGPAFPVSLPGMGDNRASGMTLRDYFAAKAMPEIYQRVETGGFERVAHFSYELADAMLKARQS